MPSVKKETAVLMVAGLILLMSLPGMAGCQRNEGGAASLPAAQGNSAVAYGRRVFDAYGCVRCHSIGGQGGQKGPDLTHVGAKPGYTLDWLMLKVRNPRALNPSSIMPPFRGSDKDLMALGGYLAGLK